MLYGVVTLALFRAFVFTDQMLWGGDTISLGYMARAFYAEALQALNGLPRWNPIILGGTPFLESLAGGDSLYPTSLLLLVGEPYRALGWKLVLHVFLAGLFMFGWIRALGGSRAAALLAGLAYLLAPYLVTLVFPGHDGKLFVTALTPLLFWAVEHVLTTRRILPLVGVALTVALVILTTHFQMAYFLFGGVGLYAAFRSVWSVRASGVRPRAAAVAFGLFLGASVLGAGVAAVQLLPAVDYVTEHSRRTATTTRASPEENRAYASQWSLHPEELVATLAVPEFAGNDAGGAPWATNTYWGRNAFKTNHEYVGVVVVVMALLSFFGGPRRGVRWFVAALGATALLYALGAHTPVWRIVYEVVPGIRLFRAPSMAVFLCGFGAVTLMALGVDRLLAVARGPEEAWRGPARGLWIAGGILGLLTVLAASGALLSAWTSVLYAPAAERQLAALTAAEPFIVRGFFLATLLVLATAGVWTAYRREWIGGGAVVALLALVLVLDLFRVDAPFLQTFDYRRWAAPDATIEYLTARQETEPPFRLFSMMGGNGQDVKPGMYGLELAAGHHPNDLARYRELIGMEGSGVPRNLLLSQNVMDLLNVRYLLWPVAEMGALESLEGLPPHLQGLRRVSEVGMGSGRAYAAVYAYPGLPRARLVGDAVVVPEEEAVERILDPGFDPSTTVLLSDPTSLALDGGPVEGTVTWEERGLNRMRLAVEADRPALLVLADNWFPAWKVRVDGEEAPLLRAYHTLRAVPVPAGRHTVELRYDSALLAAGAWISLASLVLLFGAGGAALWRERRA